MFSFFQFGLFGPRGIDPTTLGNKGGAYEIFDLIFRGVNIALGLIGTIAFIYLLIAGFQYITAAGVEAAQTQAKATIRTALIGLIITILAFTLTNTLLRVLGFNANIRDSINQNIDRGGANTNEQPVIR